MLLNVQFVRLLLKMLNKQSWAVPRYISYAFWGIW